MADIFNFTDTWNDGAVTFFAIKCNVTDTASAADSRLLSLKVGGVEKAWIFKDGSARFGTIPDNGGFGLNYPGLASGNDSTGLHTVQYANANDTLASSAINLLVAGGTLAAPTATPANSASSYNHYAHDGVDIPANFQWLGGEEVAVIGAATAGHVPVRANRWFGDGTTTAVRRTIEPDGVYLFQKARGEMAAAPTISSGATIAPTAGITFISGTTDVVNITPPDGFLVGGGSLTLIPTGVWHTTNAGNIAIASTAVVSKAMTMFYDHTTNKWYPSY
jgi:hypothetical protein